MRHCWWLPSGEMCACALIATLWQRCLKLVKYCVVPHQPTRKERFSYMHIFTGHTCTWDTSPGDAPLLIKACDKVSGWDMVAIGPHVLMRWWTTHMSRSGFYTFSSLSEDRRIYLDNNWAWLCRSLGLSEVRTASLVWMCSHGADRLSTRTRSHFVFISFFSVAFSSRENFALPNYIRKKWVHSYLTLLHITMGSFTTTLHNSTIHVFIHPYIVLKMLLFIEQSLERSGFIRMNKNK